jgi:hypothetical protein
MYRLRYVLLLLSLLLIAGIGVPLIMHFRVNSDRIICQNHLRDLGLFGVRHASIPGQPVPPVPKDELPPGTFENPTLTPERRMSWYVYTLNALTQGAPQPDPKAKRRPPAGLAPLLEGFDPTAAWDAPTHTALARYRFATAICPAQVRDYDPNTPVTTNYIASGGLGLETPALPTEKAGPNAGAYRHDGPTPFALIADGLQHTAQIIETNTNLGPWLQGGPSTLRGLDPSAQPYLGLGNQFGGCHPGGAYASMADGSVRFLKDSIDPAVFRALLTIAGGPGEKNFDEVP